MRVKLSDLYDIGSSKRVFQSEWRKSGVPFYRAREIAKLSIDGYVDNELFIDEDLYLEYIDKYGKPEAGDVMVTGVGTLGVCYVVKQEDRFYFKDGNILWFKQKAKDRILPEYLVKAFDSKDVKEFIDKNSSGTTVGTFTIQTAKKMEISLPSIEEQRNIIQKITKIESVIKQRRQELQLLDDLIKARFVEMFGDININDKNWDCEPLGDLCTIVRGGSPRPIEQFLGGDIPWIKIGDATDGDNIYLSSTKEHIIQEGVKKSRFVKSGSLIFVNCGVSLGFARIITFDGCIHDGWLAMEDIDERLDKVFLLQALNQMTEHFRAIAPAGTQPNLNTAIMKAYKQVLPPIELQRDFIRFVHQVNKSKVAVQKALDETQLLFDSLMQEYFG